MLWGSYSMVAKAVWWGSRWVTIVASHCSVNNSFLLLLSNCYVLTTLLFLAISSLFPSLSLSSLTFWRLTVFWPATCHASLLRRSQTKIHIVMAASCFFSWQRVPATSDEIVCYIIKYISWCTFMCKNIKSFCSMWVGLMCHTNIYWHLIQFSWAELALSHPVLMAINNGELICLCNEL